ncbi:MAG: PEP-CTERM sorting domain-containing protein [Phycisphaeraceae bacterium]
MHISRQSVADRPVLVRRPGAVRRAAAVILPVMALLACPAVGQARTYYVSADAGSDSGNTGSIDSPYKSIQHGIDQLQAGDTLYIRDGFYDVQQTLRPPRSGTSADWITIAGYPGEKPVLDATNAPYGRQGDSVLKIDRQDYIRVQNLRLQNSNHAGMTVDTGNHIEISDLRTDLTYDSGIGIWGDRSSGTPSRHIRVWGNRISRPNTDEAPGPSWNTRGDGTYKWPPQEAVSLGRVEDFNVGYNEIWLGDKEGIDAKGPDKRGEIHHNYIHQMERVGIYIDAWTDTLEDMHVHDNVIAHRTGLSDIYDDSAGEWVEREGFANNAGIAVNSEDNQIVRNIRINNNLVYNVERIGISVTGPYTSDVEVTNNTIVADETAVDHAIMITDTIRDTEFRDNIIVSHWQPITTDPHRSVDFDNNFFVVQGGYNSVPSGNTVFKDGDLSWVEDTFVDPANGDFHLKPGANPSPIGAASDGGDVGAFQYVATTDASTGEVTSIEAAQTLFEDRFDADPAGQGWQVSNSGHGWIRQEERIDGSGEARQVVAMNGKRSELTRELDTTGFEQILLQVEAFQADVSYEGEDPMTPAGDADWLAVYYDLGDGQGFQKLLLDDSVWQGLMDEEGNDFTMAPVTNAALWGETDPTASNWLALPGEAADNEDVRIRIATSSSSEQELYYLDRVSVIGVVIPEPASLALLGLSGIALAMRRRRG